MTSILLSIAGVIFAFGIVIFVHEFGHFIVAKKSGVKVERFSFGLGPEMFGFQWGETRYCIAWLPLGGEVRMAGEFDEQTPSEKVKDPGMEMASEGGASAAKALPRDTSRDFFSQPWYRRIAIAFAGPFMNYVLATLIFFFMLMVWGEAVQLNKTEVGEVIAGMPADKAGIRQGDKISSVQGEPTDDFISVATKIHARPNQTTDIVLTRGEEQMTIQVTPAADPSKGIGLIGIKPADPVTERRKLSPVASVKKSLWQCWNITAFTVTYLGQKIIKREMSKADVAGPIGISQVIVKAVKSGWEDFFYLIALISVSIGLFNLFPIPLLDGGHVLYYVIEGLRGKPLNQKIIARANMVGLALLMSLLVFATFNDVQRLKGDKPKTETEAVEKK